MKMATADSNKFIGAVSDIYNQDIYNSSPPS